MKKLFVPFLALIAVPAFIAGTAQAQTACIQVTQAAVSPDGTCQTYPTPCDVPDDAKAVPSCDLVETQAEKPSLEQKMNDRARRMQLYWQLKKSQQRGGKDLRENDKSGRLASGAYTRSNRGRRLPTSTSADTSTSGVTEKNYASDIRKRYSLRGGYQRAGDTTKEQRQERRRARAPFYSRSDADRSGELKTTVKWDVLSRQFTTKKQYGANPYRLDSKYRAAQKAKRAARNREVDVYQRRLSRSRVYRGERLEGNLSGDDLLDQ